MSEDLRLTSKARRIIVACWLDVSRIRVRTTRGVIHLQGSIGRLGEDKDEPEENLPFLEKAEEQLSALKDASGVKYTFDNWRREPSGRWTYTGKKPRKEKKK